MNPIFRTDLGSLFQADCLDIVPRLSEGSVDTVFADPPFNLKKYYGDHYSDSKSEGEYLSWSREWITACARTLAPGGAFFLYNIPRWNVSNAQFMIDIGLTLRHWIAIDIKLGLPISGKLYPAHYSLIYFTKGKPRRFERPRLPVQVCRHCGGDVKDYGGHRNKLHEDGINLSDVWTDIPPVRHRRTKNRGANELSEKMLERVLDISSAPGDCVLDPFGGSGTTFAVAERMHRHWVGCESGDCTPAIRRLTGQHNDVEPPGLGDAGKGSMRRTSARAMQLPGLSLQ